MLPKAWEGRHFPNACYQVLATGDAKDWMHVLPVQSTGLNTEVRTQNVTHCQTFMGSRPKDRAALGFPRDGLLCFPLSRVGSALLSLLNKGGAAQAWERRS